MSHHNRHSSSEKGTPASESQSSSHYFLDHSQSRGASSGRQGRTAPHRPSRASALSAFWLSLTAFATSLLMVACIIVPIVVLLFYIFIWHGATLEGTFIYTGAKATRVITITGVISKITEQTIVPTFGLVSTIAAAQWWKKSHAANNGEGQTPSGLQLGMTMMTISGPNLRSARKGLEFLFGTQSARPHRGISLPTTVSFSILMLCWMLLLHYAISAADFAVHLTTESFSVIEKFGSGNELDHSSMLYSRPFNTTQCSEWRAKSHFGFEMANDSCGLLRDGNTQAYLSVPEALRTMSNSSSLNAVAWADDGTAIVVAPEHVNVSYTANAVGIKTQCQSITNRCVTCKPFDYIGDDGTPKSTNTCTGVTGTSQAYLNFSCPNLNTYVNDSTSFDYVDAIIDPDTNGAVESTNPKDFFSGRAPSNPFRYAFVAESYAYALILNSSAQGLVGDTGFIQWGHLGAANVVDCNVTALHTTYKFIPPSTYKILKAEKALLNETQYLSFSIPQASQDVTTIVQGAGAVNGTMRFADAAALQFSKEMAANSAILYDAQPVLDVEGTLREGARIDIRPLLVLIALDLILCMTIGLVGLIAATVCWSARTPSADVIRSRLQEPFALLADTYGTPARPGEPTANGFDMFAPQREEDRLVLAEVWDGQRWHIKPTRAG